MFTSAANTRLQSLVEQYREAGLPWPASMRQVAAWALTHRLWEPRHSDMVAACARQLSKAMAREHYVDPQGRSVRTKHAVRIREDGQLVFIWDDIRTADQCHMQKALQQRRLQIAGNCRQLKSDVDSYNDNRSPDSPILLRLDFSEDVAEAEAFDELIRRSDATTIPPNPAGPVRPGTVPARPGAISFPEAPSSFL